MFILCRDFCQYIKGWNDVVLLVICNCTVYLGKACETKIMNGNYIAYPASWMGICCCESDSS